MITLLEEKRINHRFYLNFSLDSVKDMRDLPHHNKPWKSIGFNYGIPLPGSTALLEDLGVTYYLGKDQIWHLVGEGDSGDGSSNTVVYDLTQGSDFTADDVRSMYDNYSKGKRVLINYILGIGKILVEVTSMARTENGSGIVGSGKANLFGIEVADFSIILDTDTVQMSTAEYKFDEDFTVTVNYDAGVEFETAHWDSFDGWMRVQHGGGAGSIAAKYNYVIVKTECNLSSSKSTNDNFKVNGKCYFGGISHDAPVRLHPGDTIEPLEHCSPNITLSAAILDAPTIGEDSVLTNEMVNAMF